MRGSGQQTDCTADSTAGVATVPEEVTSLAGRLPVVIFPNDFSRPMSPPPGVTGVFISDFPGLDHPEKSSGVAGIAPENEGWRARAEK
jgi:hypothetical protein